MKFACVNISSDILIGKTQEDNLPFLAKKLLSCGVSLSNIYVVENNPEEITNVIKNLDHDFVVILGENDSVKNFNIKNTLANFWGENIVKSESCAKFVANYFKAENIPVLAKSENEFYIINNSIPLNNGASYMQGFMYTFKNTSFVFMPNDKQSIEFLFNNSLEPIITKERKIAYETLSINTFGISEKDIQTVLGELINNKYKIIISTYADGLDVTLNIRYNVLTPSEIVNVFVGKVYEKLQKYIYSDGETSLYQMALDLLTIGNKSLAIAETITGGQICSEFNKCSSPAKQLIFEGRVMNTQFSQKGLLNVNSNVVNKYGKISVEAAYEMATSLLETSQADLVLVTCGDIESENRICYLAVGDMDGIHVYKNSYSGTKDKVISTISKCGVFYLIKKLKQNDLFFNRITV